MASPRCTAAGGSMLADDATQKALVLSVAQTLRITGRATGHRVHRDRLAQSQCDVLEHPHFESQSAHLARRRQGRYRHT